MSEKTPETVDKVDMPDPYIETDGTSFTHAYPGAKGTLYHTFRIAKTIDKATLRVLSYILIISTTHNDPREDDFLPTEDDENMVVPMTESSVYGLMQVLTALRADMDPEASAMLSTMFEHGHFQRH